MNFFDYFLISIIGLSMVLSVWRGFVREFFSLLGIILAFFVAGHFSSDAAVVFDVWIENKAASNIGGFILLFIVVMMVVGILGTLVRGMIQMAALTTVDRTLGVFFGAGRGMLLIGVAFLVYTSYSKPDQTWMKQSVLTPYAMQLSHFIGQLIPKGYPFSTQPLSLSTITKQTLDRVEQYISPDDQKAMQAILVNSLEETLP